MDLKKKFQEAFDLHKKGKLLEAKKIYTQILEKSPNDFNCLHHLGLIAKNNNEYRSAFEFISKAIKIKPNSSQAHFNLANVLVDMNKMNEAIQSYDSAIKIQPDYELYLLRGNALFNIEELNLALQSYNEAILLKPDCFQAYNNKGLVLAKLRKFDSAIDCYDQAIKINSNFPDAIYHQGLALRSIGKIKESIKYFEKAIKLEPNHLKSLYELALIYKDKKNHNLALSYCEQILKIDQNHSQTILLGIKIRKNICDWTRFEKDLSYATKKINNNEESVGPFSSIAFFNDPILQKKSSEIHTSNNYPLNNFFGNILRYKKHEKIRIAYFSPDFCEHPVSNLIVELIEKHNSERFEIYAFSLVDWPEDGIKKRLKKAFKKFINVANELPKNIVKLSRQMEIDIAVDLALFTGQNKPEIFSMRTAPIQINYLGFANTSGASYFDYIIADEILIPKNLQKYYSEKILYLDIAYPNDTKKIEAKSILKRKYFNLPNDCFIFCSINNNYKYNPLMFDSWMKILNEVKNSILFLKADNEEAKQNLKSEAKKRNINPNRLMFADKLEYSEYLQRLSLMDLFLDTFPFNGHSTSCDALWAGLPILTLTGDTYGSRVCASLLNSVKLNSLVTYSNKDYESLAVYLAKNPQELMILRKKLLDKTSLNLFNIQKFAKNIEDGYQKIYDRHHKDLPPTNIK